MTPEQEIKLAEAAAEFQNRMHELLDKHGLEHWADARHPAARAEFQKLFDWHGDQCRAAYGRRKGDGELLPDELARRRQQRAAGNGQAPKEREEVIEMTTATKRRKASPTGTRLRGKDLKQRNREIVAALKKGESIESVARRYRLRPKTVGYIRWVAGKARRIPARA